MDRGPGGKKRKKAQKAKHKTEADVETVVSEIHQFDIAGVLKLFLSLPTQEAIGCVIGEDITPENSWIPIPKERLTDILFEENSELEALKEEITKYPEEEILLGYDPSLKCFPEEILICLTKEAKHEVLDIIRKHKEETYQKLKESLVKCPREWKSLGSEEEVNDSQPKNFRPLIELKVQTKFPLYDTPTKFSMRLVEDARDGYVKLVSTRETFNNVTRKCVDRATQVAPPTEAKEAQTNPPYPQNKWTQYCFKYEKRTEMTNAEMESILQSAEQLCEEIRVNEHIDFHSYDYSHRNLPMFKPLCVNIPRQLLFQDVMWCRGKKASSIAWHPSISGMLVASYMEEHPFEFTYAEMTKDRVYESVHSKKVALLWCFTDNLQPKLYMSSHREVSVVSFCEYDPNIIVGGLDNGQVVLWDITGRLEEVETTEMLTEMEQQHRKAMHLLIGWMKRTRDAAWIQPTVVSASGYSHKDRITGITWLPRTHSITRNGKVEYDPNKVSLQFLTCSLDGLIHVWDLNSNPIRGQHGPQRRGHGRLKTRPSALTLNVSWLKSLDKLFAPQFRLIVEDGSRMPITDMVLITTTCSYTYTPRNPETMNKLFERTYFDRTVNESSEHFEQLIVAATSTGKLLRLSWEGNDFDQGQVVNSEKCKVEQYECFHDGPVRTCISSPSAPDILLTVGGTMFAIWSVRHVKSMLWRKCEVEYVSGVWSSILLMIIVLNRIDGYMEIWNIHRSTNRPAVVVHVTSNIIHDLVTHNQRIHTRKNTVAMTDSTGAVHILVLPMFRDYFLNINVEKVRKIMMTRMKRKLDITQWIKEWYESHSITENSDNNLNENQEGINSETKELAVVIKDEEDEQLDTFNKILTEKWASQHEKDMYFTLLKLKKLNLKKINLESKPLREERLNKQKFKLKQACRIAEKDQVFERAKMALFRHSIMKPQTEITLDALGEEELREMKESYMTHYYQIEEECQAQILFQPRCNWPNWTDTETKRQKSVKIRRVNLHHKRYEQEVLAQKAAQINIRTMDFASRMTFGSVSETSSEKSD